MRISLLTCLCVFGLGVLTMGCTQKDTCGNGSIEAGESCDGSNLGGASCQGLGYMSGTLGCTDGCLFEVSACDGLIDCGNGVVDAGEQCDGSDLDDETCETRALGEGELACDPITCQFNASGCEGGGICGDGVADGNEECDGIDFRGLTCPTLDGSYIGGQLDCSPLCVLRTSACYVEPDFPIGAPCESDADCPQGRCVPELGGNSDGAPGGVCVERCDDEGNCPLAGDAGVCATTGGYWRFCYRRCDPLSPECRDGYDCVPQGDTGYCYPHCTDDSQCVVTGNCETDPGSEDEGWCVPLPEICTGGVDEDVDGLVDCSDPDCNGQPACPSGEICLNGIDDDGDGLADCDDGECYYLGVCSGELCSPVAGALLGCGDTLAGETNDASGSTDEIRNYQCLDPSGGPPPTIWGESGDEYVYTLTVPSSQLVTLTLSNFGGNLDLLVLKQFGGQYCDPAYGCFAYGNSGPGTDEVVTFTAHSTMTYYVIVDGRMGNVSSYDPSVTCDATGYEDCGNGVDDDGDGLDDCNDPECFDVVPHCGTAP